jgi:hypothetical protein
VSRGLQRTLYSKPVLLCLVAAYIFCIVFRTLLSQDHNLVLFCLKIWIVNSPLPNMHHLLILPTRQLWFRLHKPQLHAIQVRLRLRASTFCLLYPIGHSQNGFPNPFIVYIIKRIHHGNRGAEVVLEVDDEVGVEGSNSFRRDSDPFLRFDFMDGYNRREGP